MEIEPRVIKMIEYKEGDWVDLEEKEKCLILIDDLYIMSAIHSKGVFMVKTGVPQVYEKIDGVTHYDVSENDKENKKSMKK